MVLQNKGSVIKIVTKRICEDQISENVPKVSRKRAGKVLQVAADFKITQSDVEVTSHALKDRSICLLSEDEDCSREQLIRIIQTHNGKVVANYGEKFHHHNHKNHYLKHYKYL